MNYFTIAPSPALASYIRFFWVLESDAPYYHRSMADGCVEMVLHYHGTFDEIKQCGNTESSFLSGLHGLSQQFRRYYTGKSFGIFGVYLYPYALPALFGMPTHALSDCTVDLETIPGIEGAALEEQVMPATSTDARVQLMTNFFLRRLRRHEKENHTACVNMINSLIHTETDLSIEKLAQQSFLSMRQFERNFKQLSGFTPKLYSRILRFQRATQRYGMQKLSLTQLAYDCGYYDQSHFIHEFKQFSGYHPKQYFSGKAEGVEWKDSIN